MWNLNYFLFTITLVKTTTASLDILGNINELIGSEDATLNFTGLVAKYNYTYETHKVTTEDGYILTMFRITGSPKCVGAKKKIPLVFMHGLIDTCDTFVLSGAEDGIGFIVADECYDAWFPNSRGNHYSLEHETLSTDDHSYWEFSFDELGKYDTAAVVDYVLDTTGSDTLNYIGHSQGTTDFFILASTRPDYVDKINVAICLAPIAWLHHLSSPLLKTIALFTPELQKFFNIIGVDDIFSRAKPGTELVELACQLFPKLVCETVLDVLSGLNYTDFTRERMQVLFGHYPAATSVQNLVHYGQGINVDKFRRFDHGDKENTARYGTNTPPDYELGNVTTNVVLMSGQNDLLSVSSDIETLKKNLPNVVEHYIVPDGKFGHADFVWGLSVPDVIAPRIFEYLDKYGN